MGQRDIMQQMFPIHLEKEGTNVHMTKGIWRLIHWKLNFNLERRLVTAMPWTWSLYSTQQFGAWDLWATRRSPYDGLGVNLGRNLALQSGNLALHLGVFCIFDYEELDHLQFNLDRGNSPILDNLRKTWLRDIWCGIMKMHESIDISFFALVLVLVSVRGFARELMLVLYGFSGFRIRVWLYLTFVSVWMM